MLQRKKLLPRLMSGITFHSSTANSIWEFNPSSAAVLLCKGRHSQRTLDFF